MMNSSAWRAHMLGAIGSLVLLPLLQASCTLGDTPEEMQQAHYALESELAEMEATVDSLQRQLRSVRLELNEQRWLDSVAELGEVSLDPSNPDAGFSILDTPYGTLTVDIENVEPIADGSRVTLRVGNLTSAIIHGGTLFVRWGVRPPDSESESSSRWEKYGWSEGDQQSEVQRWGEWSSSLRSDNPRFNETLQPGTWNTFRISLPGVSPDHLGYLTVRVESFESISLAGQ